MPVQRSFHLMLTPTCKVEVGAPDITTALAVARDALPFLQDTHDEQRFPVSLSDSDDFQYTLTCLLCRMVNPQHASHSHLIAMHSHLVAMQEHLIAAHQLTPEHFRAACRVFLGTGDEGCYVWALAPVLAAQLHLPHKSYMRARRYTAAPSVPVEKRGPQPDGYVTLVFVHPFDASETRQDVFLVDLDALAWYGYRRGDLRVGEPLVWPKGEWSRADEAGR